MSIVNVPHSNSEKAPYTPVIIFDFGGVVGGSDKAIVQEEVEKSLSIQVDEAEVLLKEMREAKREGLSQEQFWKEYEEKNNCHLPKGWVEHLEVTRLLAIRTNPDVLNLVFSLRKRGYRVGLLSNVTKRRAQFIRELGIYDLFDPVLLSCDLGVEKPNPQVFHILCERLCMLPKDIILIDNKPETIAAAQKFGLQSIHYESLDDLKKELAQYLS
jgi:putative hydrolase of the HAD superfamily